MYINNIFKRISLISILSVLVTSVAFAHPGHEVANNQFHGLFHIESFVVLFTISMVLVIFKLIKNLF